MIPSTQHPPAPGATPGNKTQWEASPGMPGKPVAGLLGFFSFSNSRDPSWRTCRLETLPYLLEPKLLGGPGAERDALHSHGAGPAPPSTHLPPRLPASLRRGKSDFSLSLDLHPSTRWWWWWGHSGPAAPPGPKWGGKGVPHHGGRSHPGIGHPQGRVERGTSSPAVPRCRGTPAQRRPPPPRGRETIFAVAKKVSPLHPPDISQAAKLR